MTNVFLGVFVFGDSGGSAQRRRNYVLILRPGGVAPTGRGFWCLFRLGQPAFIGLGVLV